MKTLSDDITLTLPTNDLQPGYVQMTVYAQQIGVFSGRTLVDGINDIKVNINDFIVQNRNKYDYLKLNDDKTVSTLPVVYDGGYGSRFVDGQIKEFTVHLKNNSEYFQDVTASTYVLMGYDYSNKDLVPNVDMDNNITNVTRIMQGANWTANHSTSTGEFNNLLLPHYPAIATDKYGLGLQLQIKGAYEYTLSSEATPSSSELYLGYSFVQAAQTFVSLNTLLTNQLVLNEDKDTSVYLKLNTSVNNEFGDYEETPEYYYNNVGIRELRVTYYNGSTVKVINYSKSDQEFRTYLQEYKDAALNTFDKTSKYYTVNLWDVEKIINNDLPVYSNRSNRYQSSKESSLDANNFSRFYTALEVESTEAGKQAEVQPRFLISPTLTVKKTVYSGKCPVAILDRCYSRYYLAWNDRYGDIMSQPFAGKFTYNEGIEKDEIIDYKFRRKVSKNEIQPSWTLNTTWITDDLYPMYEAIFTSPYLLLYDTETDRSWNVILTNNNYKEKNHKNERKLFNLEITVEAIQKQTGIF